MEVFARTVPYWRCAVEMEGGWLQEPAEAETASMGSAMLRREAVDGLAGFEQRTRRGGDGVVGVGDRGRGVERGVAGHAAGRD